MSKNLGETLFKLLGLFAIIQAVRMTEFVFSYLALDRENLPILQQPLWSLSIYVPFLLLLGGGCFLVLRSRQLAGARPVAEGGAGEPISTAHTHSILVTLAGLILIGISLSELPATIWELTLVLSGPQDPPVPIQHPGRAWGGVIGVLLQLGLGLLLVLKSTALISLFRRRWNRARPEAADAQCPHCGYWIVMRDYREGAPGYRCDNCKGEIPRDLLHTTSAGA